MTPLHIAILAGLPDIMKLLLERKVDLGVRDQFGNTPLLLAVREGADDAARTLIAAGADVNAGSPLTGDGPLDVALELGNASLAETLRARSVRIMSIRRIDPPRSLACWISYSTSPCGLLGLRSSVHSSPFRSAACSLCGAPCYRA